MNFVKQPGFWFGMEAPIAIRGFETVCAPDEFARVRQGEKEFIVQIFPNHYRLSPYGKDTGFIARTDRAINIPKE